MPTAPSKRTAEEKKAASTPQEYTYDGPFEQFYQDAAAEARGEFTPIGGKVSLSPDQVAMMQVYGHRFIGHGVKAEDTTSPQTPFPVARGVPGL